MSTFKTGFHFNFSWNALCCAILIGTAWWFGAVALLEIFSDFSNQWPWLLAAYLYALIPLELFLHLVMSHRLFPVDPTRWSYKILTFLATTHLAIGSCSSFISLHHSHHVYSDQPGKDHAYFSNWWQNLLYYSVSPLLFFLNPKFSVPDSYYKEQYNKNINIHQDTWTWICGEFFVILTVLYWAILWFTLPEILFKIVFVSRVLFSFANLISSHYFDWTGYRNFRTGDNSTNHLFFHYLFLCLNSTFLHNNHHSVNLKKGHRIKWYEFDLGFLVIQHILKPLLIPRKQ